jgi:hypothetical protein
MKETVETRKDKSPRRGIAIAVRSLALALLLLLPLSLPFALTASAAWPETAVLSVKQSLSTGEATAPDGAFEYLLTSEDGAPLPEGAAGGYTFIVDGGGAANETDKYISIGFAHPGIYKYRLRCVTEPDQNYTVDTSIYKIEVWAFDKSPPWIGVYVYNEAGEKVEDSVMVFNHSYSYTPPGPPGPPSGPSDPTGPSGPTEPSGPEPPESPEDTETPSGPPGPPTPSPGGWLEPTGNGTYIEYDENGTPIGEWSPGPDGEWIFEEFPPAAELPDMPQTGDETGYTEYMLLFRLAAATAFVCVLLLIVGRRREDETEEVMPARVPAS